MRRNAGIIGPVKSVIGGVYDTFDAYNNRRVSKWPLSFRYNSLSTNSGTILENTVTTLTLNTSGFESNVTLYWTILNGTSTSSDFFNSVVSGSFTQSGTTNTGSFSFTTAFTGNTSKSTKTFQIQIREGSTSGTVVFTSGVFSIPAITSSVSWSTSPVNEGSSSNLQVTLGNMGSWSSWTATISYTGTASSGDFTAGLPSSMNVNSGTSTLTFSAIADVTTEGTESLTASVSYGGFSLGSAALSISDTSTAITATVTPTVSSVNEGSTVTFNISITSGNFSSGTLYWTLAVSGPVGNSDFSSPASAVTSGGSVSISSSAGSVAFTLASDSLTETTAESFQLQLRANSTSGTIIQTSSSVTINDTSQGSATDPVFSSGTYRAAGGLYSDGRTGWTLGSVTPGNFDDSFATFTSVGLTFKFNNTAYTTFYVGTNGYITFSSGQSYYSPATISTSTIGVYPCPADNYWGTNGANGSGNTASAFAYRSGTTNNGQNYFRANLQCYAYGNTGINRVWEINFIWETGNTKQWIEIVYPSGTSYSSSEYGINASTDGTKVYKNTGAPSAATSISFSSVDSGVTWTNHGLGSFSNITY